jgi:predicted negative regulator of RcsB-dependent stress response
LRPPCLRGLYDNVALETGEGILSAKKLKGVSTFAPLSSEPAGFVERVKAWAETHTHHIAVAVIVVLVILLGLWGTEAYRNSKEKNARAAYAQLSQGWPKQENFDPKIWEKMIPELEKYIGEHQGTAPALDAQMDLASAYFHTQRYEDALKWEKKILENVPSDDGLRFLATYRMALTYEALGRTDEAIAQWTALKTEGSSGFSREMYWHLGRLYAKKNDHARAIEQYEEALQSTGAYPDSALLQDELSSLKLKAGTGHESSRAEAPKEKP